MALQASLQDALASLRVQLRKLESQALEVQTRPEPSFLQLKEIITELAKPKLFKPPKSFEECRAEWIRYAQRGHPEPGRRAIRNLCWVTEIALTPQFLSYIEPKASDLGTRAIQGLVRSCHMDWADEKANSPAVTAVRSIVSGYSGRNPRINEWQKHPDLILSAKGPLDLAKTLVESRMTPASICEHWGIDTASGYAHAVAKRSVEVGLKALTQEPKLTKYVLEQLVGWPNWFPSEFREIASEAILSRAASNPGAFRDQLRDLVVDDPRLGDPRLPRNRSAWGGYEEARRQFIQWLSRFDIAFFFEHVLPDGDDPHGRRDFWLQYVDKLVQCRPLLGANDRSRLEATFRRNPNRHAHFGEIKGEPATSAFLLDFGRILVIEFSPIGAIYVFQGDNIQHVARDPYAVMPFTVSQLKRKDLAIDRITHQRRWEYKMRNVLSQYGIRR